MLPKPTRLLLSDATGSHAEGDLSIEALRGELELSIGVVGCVGDRHARWRGWDIDGDVGRGDGQR